MTRLSLLGILLMLTGCVTSRLRSTPMLDLSSKYELRVALELDKMLEHYYLLNLRLINTSPDSASGCFGPTWGVESPHVPSESIEMIAVHRSHDFTLESGEGEAWPERIPMTDFRETREVVVCVDIYSTGCRKHPSGRVCSSSVRLPEP